MRTAWAFVHLWARVLFLVFALIPNAQATSSRQLGFRQLGATSAKVDLARLHNQLCDILGSIYEINGHGQSCTLPCDEPAHQTDDQCKDRDTYDLAPSARLL